VYVTTNKMQQNLQQLCLKQHKIPQYTGVYCGWVIRNERKISPTLKASAMKRRQVEPRYRICCSDWLGAGMCGGKVLVWGEVFRTPLERALWVNPATCILRTGLLQGVKGRWWWRRRLWRGFNNPPLSRNEVKQR
jgi:hypothetical protein